MASQTHHQESPTAGQQGTVAEIYRVPGHMGVAWNKKANEVVKMTAKRVGIQRYPEHFNSLTHIELMITNGKWNEIRHWFTMENDRTPPLQRARYDPTLESQDPDTAAIEKEVQVSRLYFQLN